MTAENNLCTAEDNEVFTSADQTSLPPLSTKGGKLELASKTVDLTVDQHFRGLGAFVKSDLLHPENDQLNTSTSHPILLPISLCLTTTPHSIFLVVIYYSAKQTLESIISINFDVLCIR